MRIGNWDINFSNNTGAKTLSFAKKLFSINKNSDKTRTYVNIMGINFASLPKLVNLDSKIFTDMKEVRESGLWDAKYYIQKYHPEMNIHEALVHYVTEGYKKKESPSEIFDAAKYDCPIDVNPISHFLNIGRYCFYNAFFKNEFPAKEETINKYWEIKQTRQSKKVIYTCITNNYDSLEEIKAFYYTDPSWDYVCFTDNEEDIKAGKIGIWEIQPLAFDCGDNSLNNRYHKINPHIVLPGYNESVYLDANINILTPKFFEMVNNTDKDILLPAHPKQTDLYKELLWAKNTGFQSSQTIDELYKIFKEDGFPANYGMSENNIIYRKHKEKQITEMMTQWWKFVSEYCKRDQGSLAYVFWKHNRKFENYTFENARIDYKNFCVFTHKKRWELCK